MVVQATKRKKIGSKGRWVCFMVSPGTIKQGENVLVLGKEIQRSWHIVLPDIHTEA